ncbi:RNA chaperone ProQ [Neiella marina]|uniref:RNA chaperone ProQ n=1 Tax=Neiella holothuriorum TaxID=2870530 RepID=A0ABS7EEP2_9GAMM|nr:RNA chaperone ProQ [Neiella holothuriorum]MBW8190271.1 RNA chaperone ProQ [Neiella holothuriorum]
MEQQPKLTENREIIAFLAEQYPQCFVLEGDAKPLKIGIFQDLVEQLASDDRISNTRLRQAIRHYTSSMRYLMSVKAEVLRVNLDGTTGDAVTADHEGYAQERLTEIRQRIAERKKQALEARKAKEKEQGKKARPAKAKRASKPAGQKPRQDKKPAPKPVVNTKPLDANELEVGKPVQILVGSNPVQATIAEVLKESVRVTLASGMAIEVANDRVVGA